MKTGKHISEDNRKTICSCISHNKKLIEISKIINYDPRAISKEVKRNRKPVDYADQTESKCPKLNRCPYVCTNCKNRYKDCPFVKFIYDSKGTQREADANLINSRKGIDLPYAVKYKKRKHNKKYEYTDNKIDKSNHTYLDYLSYIHKNPNCNVWQLDFLGTIKSDSKNILSFILPNVHFTLLDIINNPNSKKVVESFDDLEDKIGIESFKDLIPVILTDRDPCFNDIEGICFSKATGEERCKLFFCDSYVSNQKPHVENINKQIRKFFPKGKSIDNHTKESVKNHNITLLNTPKDEFITVYGEDLYKNF